MSETVTPRPERKATLRLGQRELSLMTFAVIGVVVIGCLFAGWGVFKRFKAQRDIVIAKDNLHALHTALKGGYALDYEGRLPPAEGWADTALGYLSAPPNKPGGKEAFLRGPGDSAEVRYAYNTLAAGYSLETNKDAQGNVINPRDLVLLIEQPGAPLNATVTIPPHIPGDRNAEAALREALRFPHFEDDEKNAATVVLYADGTIKTYLRRDFQ